MASKPEDDADPLHNRHRVRSQLASDDRFHALGRATSPSCHIAEHALFGLRLLPYSRHVDGRDQPVDVRLAQHQFQTGIQIDERRCQNSAEERRAGTELGHQGARSQDQHHLLHDRHLV